MTDTNQAHDLFRLYRPEWITVFTTHEGADRAITYFETTYRGRVYDTDMKIIDSSAGSAVARVQLQLRLPNLKGEFKHAYLAQRHAETQGWDEWTIVARNSKADHDLRGYSVKKLPTKEHPR